MCSRYTLKSAPYIVQKLFGYETPANFPPRYNIAPTQPVAIVRVGADRKRELALVRWGLIPSWVKDPTQFSTLINARSETALEKPSFRAAMKYRRCLFPADGFFEWSGPRSHRQPYFIKPIAEGPIGLAGLWEHWMGPDGSEMESAAILTTSANDVIAPLHDRMPAILAPEDFDAWLDIDRASAGEAHRLLAPAPNALLEAVAISTRINNPRNDTEDVLEPDQKPLI